MASSDPFRAHSQNFFFYEFVSNLFHLCSIVRSCMLGYRSLVSFASLVHSQRCNQVHRIMGEVADPPGRVSGSSLCEAEMVVQRRNCRIFVVSRPFSLGFVGTNPRASWPLPPGWFLGPRLLYWHPYAVPRTRPIRLHLCAHHGPVFG